ncbi:HAD family hydrolase [Pedobacter metabolipauper]|uniref:phosphoglycolate phosphatase n=1 Tax=Pedobacter metabolipauper TaxID=425513 RepID=A0A4R6SWW3_9SPHI|nr:HAD hydrolase-like protein [Pedobacter metabolipauper]TDQ09931.1 phosphoglycolate phosphatase-like HAD superfamily hydrolase [Pedobacter metabolipauper]
MKDLLNYKAILWDFDGVLMDSMPIRDKGFTEVLKQYPKEQVDELMAYHRANGGLSRYVKFRYFFENIRKEKISEDQVLTLANDFSGIMLQLLINQSLLINDSLEFVIKYHKEVPMHIVSGSDGNELRHICGQLKIDQYFVSISGSPTPKKILVKELLNKYKYAPEETILIGDAVNDYDAAVANEIQFAGYNNPSLLTFSNNYITLFKDLQKKTNR